MAQAPAQAPAQTPSQTPSAANGGADKLAALLTPVINNAIGPVRDQSQVNHLALLLALERIEVRLGVIEGLVTAAKAPKTTKPKAADAAAPAAGAATPAAGTAPAAAAAPAPTSFAANQYIWFKQQWNKPEYRTHMLTANPTLAAAIEGNADVKAAKDDKARNGVEQKVAWEWIKANQAAADSVKNQYDAEKKAYLDARNPQAAPLQTEPNSPK